MKLVAKLLKLFRKDLHNNGSFTIVTLTDLKDRLDSLAEAKDRGFDIYQGYDDLIENIASSAVDSVSILENVIAVYEKLLKLEAKIIMKGIEVEEK